MIQFNKRLKSLDAFRGLTIAGMILVNTPGSWSYVYPPLLHAEWHGCTPTDLVFPFFLFIVGVSMSYSFSKFNYNYSAESGKKLLKRTILIFVVGLLLNAYPFFNLDISSFRIMGVLQRIALAFGAGGLIILLLSGRKYLLVGSTAIILLSYWALLFFLGGEDPYGLESNLVRKVDIAVLGENHLYRGFGLAFDPEGILSTLPSVGTVLIGFLFGRFLKENIKEQKDMLIAILAGTLLVLAGWTWGFIFPVNKALWTSSYVLYTSGLAILLLSLFYWLIDVKEWKTWSNFFVVFGVNPLFAFVFSGIWIKTLIYIIRFNNNEGELINAKSWLYSDIFVPIAGNMNGSLLFALAHIALYWLLLYIMFKRKVFIKI